MKFNEKKKTALILLLVLLAPVTCIALAGASLGERYKPEQLKQPKKNEKEGNE